MIQSLFTRLVLLSTAVLLIFAAGAGVMLDGFLTKLAYDQLIEELESKAKIAEEVIKSEGVSQGLVKRMSEAAGARVTIVDMDGTVIADSKYEAAKMDNHANRPELVSAAKGVSGHSERVSPTLGEEMLYVAIPSDPMLRLAVGLDYVKDALWQVRKRILLASLPAVLIALSLAYAIFRSLSRRFNAMREFTLRLSAKEYDAELIPSGKDEMSDLERGLVSLRDELKGQMETLDAESRRLRLLVDGLPDGVLVFDADGRLAVANNFAVELLRLSPEEMHGLTAPQLFRNPEIAAGVGEHLSGNGGDLEGFRVNWPEPVREIEVHFRPVPDEEGRRGVLVVLRDISKEAHLERVRSDFISNMAHEVRTPLTAIRGAAETLLDNAMSDAKIAPRFLDTIRRHTIRLENILSDISELSRIEGRGAPVNIVSFDARAPVEEVAALFNAEAQNRGLTLTSSLPDKPISLVSDEEKVDSILINLVQNALRYTHEGGSIEVSVKQRERGVVYTVSDTGIGIPEEAVSRVTERFYRVDPGRSRAQGGTGLGLAIVNHLVTLLDGKLAIKSRVGEGTTVSVELPSEVA
ncbi:MAG: hypothetical protein C0608_09625 [Deltaproteobacteria bacterium]|nr:MAG: hypothetical protein C0608_09625 [Deltaproteobacteria bacterium]